MPSHIFSIKKRVYIDQTDAGQIVYHANYLIFLEHCRRLFLESINFNYNLNDDGQRLFFVVKSANIDYVRPLALDDEFLVNITAIKTVGAKIIFKQNIEKDGMCYCSADIVIVCVTQKNGKIYPNKIPNVLQHALKSAINTPSQTCNESF